MARNRYYKGLIGLNTEVVVAAATAYAANATYAEFVADDANEGQIGIFNADTNELITAAMTEGTRYFFAQKRDGDTAKSSTFIYNKSETKKIAYTAPVKQVATVTFAADFTPARYDEIIVSLIETTPGNTPFPRWDYSVQAKAGETRAALLGRLRDAINDPNHVTSQENGQIAVAVLAGDALTLTAYDFGATFRVALSEKSFDVASVAYTTPFKLGSGYYDHVADLEEAGNIFEGVTTNYPNQNVTAAEFGKPVQFATKGKTYNIYQVDDTRTGKTPIPVSIQFHNHHIAVAIPVGEDGPEASVAAVLGF